MRTNYLLFSLCLLAGFLSAQQADLTLIFQLTDAEAETIFKNEKLALDSSHFHTLVDTFHTPDHYSRHLPAGYYLHVKADWEQVNIEFKDETTLRVQHLPDRRDLAFHVLDSLGQEVKNAQVHLNNKSIDYDQTTQSYRLPRRKRGGLLKVQARGETIFYLVENDRIKAYRHRFKYTTVGYIATSPIRWGKGIYAYFKRGIGWGDWQVNWRRTLNFFPWRWFDDNREMKGIIAFSQPKYRHGDTLLVKAFLQAPNGRPWKKEAQVQVRADYKRPLVVDTLLPPNHPGNFTFDLILADSLTLDKHYAVSFDHPRSWRTNPLTHRFYLEDYQLDEVVYSIRPEKEIFYASDSMVLIAEAKDQNGLFVPDVRVSLVVKRGSISEFWKEEVRIPDTLWTHEQMLETGDATRITLPDSLLPEASLQLAVDALFQNTKGELQDKQFVFSFQRDSAHIDVREENGEIIARYFFNGTEEEKQVFLEAENRELDFSVMRQVTLPFRERIHPYQAGYRFFTGIIETNYEILASAASIQAQGYHTSDSVFISVQNPQRIPFRYRIGPKGRIVEEGLSDAVYFQWKQKAPADTPYFLEYQYVWGGQPAKNQIPLQRYKNLLQVDLDYPAKVYPGDSLTVTVRVRDQRDQPVRNADLTAGAVNAQFAANRPFLQPEIKYKRPKEPRTFNRFSLQHAGFSNQTQLPMTAAWADQLKGKRQLFYRLRYSGTGVFMEYDSISTKGFYGNIAQFAPYVLKKGKAQPIALIYCNRELVYYHGVDDQPPYSFVGRPGYNSLIIRTTDREYTLDSILLKKGQKLEIAIDADHYRYSPLAKNIRVLVAPTTYTAQERALVEQSIFQLHESHPGALHFLWQDSLHIHRFDGSARAYPFWMGPFRENSRLHYWSPEILETDFIFEPGFRYVLRKGREKLYQSPIFPVRDPAKLPVSLPLQACGQLVIPPAGIAAPAKETFVPARLSSSSPHARSPQTGSYQFAYHSRKDTSLVAVVLVSDQGEKFFFRPSVSYLAALLAGKYQLYLFANTGHYAKNELEVQANSLLYQYLDTIAWQVDSLQLFSELFYGKKVLPVPPLVEPDQQSFMDSLLLEGPAFRITGKVTDENGEPLIGASILIAGTNKGTISDLDGYYELEVPYGLRNPQIIINYVGYNSRQLPVGSNARNVDVQLDTDEARLEEVVVTALGVQAKRALGYSVITTDAMQSRTAGLEVTEDARIKIRGLASLDGDLPPLYIVDGKVVPNILDLSPDRIDKMEVLKNAEAVGLYGAQAAHGVVLITTRRTKQAEFTLAGAPNSIRSNFRDHALWQPILRTDQRGEARFRTKFPDNITSWDAFVIAMHRKKQAGTAFANIQSFKPLLAQLAVPRFLVEGDEADVIGTTVNYIGDSLTVKTRFEQAGQSFPEKEQTLGESLVEKTRIRVGTDSLELTYRLEMEGYFDGERRPIPVFPKGAEESRGQFWVLDRDTTFRFDADPALGPVQLYAQGNVLALLLEDLQYLRQYPYGCNEQTASRLMALLLQKELNKQLNIPFPYERQITNVIKRLVNGQNTDGSWGWWPDNPINHWMTIYVAQALQQAQKAGYDTPAMEKALRLLTNRLSLLNTSNRLQTLQLLSEAGQPVDFATALASFDTLQLELSDRLRVLKIRQEQKLPFSLDSLYHYRKQTLFGGHYWEEPGQFWYPRTTEPTLLAYQVLKAAGKEEEATRIRRFFLETRGRYSRFGWTNTYETAQVLQAILPDLLDGASQDTLATPASQLEINGALIGQFPMERTFPADRSLSVKKNGKAPVFLTAYQTAFNRAPEPKEDIFRIQTQLWQDEQPVDSLHAGNKALLRVSLEVKSVAEYVMLEIPIPGSCSYFDKPLYHRFPESHREYFKEKTVIFCESLPEGNYTFDIWLEPRFTGVYTLNPARVEQMYFPVFYGHNGMKAVAVED